MLFHLAFDAGKMPLSKVEIEAALVSLRDETDDDRYRLS
jgi:hypothetical protein